MGHKISKGNKESNPLLSKSSQSQSSRSHSNRSQSGRLPSYQLPYQYHQLQSVVNVERTLANSDKYTRQKDITNIDELEHINILIQDKRKCTPNNEHNHIRSISLKSLIDIIVFQYDLFDYDSDEQSMIIDDEK